MMLWVQMSEDGMSSASFFKTGSSRNSFGSGKYFRDETALYLFNHWQKKKKNVIKKNKLQWHNYLENI